MLRKLLIGVALVQAASASAQTAPRPNDIVVTASRDRASNWRAAETSHVRVLSDGSEAELVRITRNLEALHALLTALMGRSAEGDVAEKLQVTLIGDLAEFTAMDLRNTRWQQGPYVPAFELGRYYDPREDGAVMASTRAAQPIQVERGASFSQVLTNLPELQPAPGESPGASADAAYLQGALLGLATDDRAPTIGDSRVVVRAESLLYAGYAQHWLMTYYPAAYPRWYLDGFGQLFSTMQVDGGRTIEYGRAPEATGKVLNRLGGYPLAKVLDGSYLTGGDHTRWTPVHAWLLTHYLFFDDTRRPQLRRYLAALANGVAPATAAQEAFGDVRTLAGEVRRYHGQRKPWFRIGLREDWAEVPAVRRLSIAQAEFVKGRLELGGRVDVATAGDARARWLAGLRRAAARYPLDPTAQLLLAEAECRSGNAAECAAAADRVLQRNGENASALAWKGLAMLMAAARLPKGERASALATARATIGRANRVDQDAVLPLIMYGRTFLDTGDTPTPVAVVGLARAVSTVPASPASRLRLAQGLVARGEPAQARVALLPVVSGPYYSPEQAPARALLATLPPAR